MFLFAGVIEFLTTGRVLANHIDFKELGYESSLQKLNTSDSKDALSHNFRLSRAYDDDTMPYTNFTYVDDFIVLWISQPCMNFVESSILQKLYAKSWIVCLEFEKSF